MNNFLKFLKKNKTNITIIVISIITFIIGGFAINWITSGIIVGILVLLLFLFSKKKPKKKNAKKKKKKWLKIILIIGLSFLILSIIGAMIFIWLVIKNAPEFDPNKLYQKEATIIYSSKGEIIAKLGTEKREKITYDELPEVLIDAIIATEDSRFFQHNGFDLPRFLKASFGQALGQNAGGASTLTMQVVKNHLTSTESKGLEGIIRKFTDIYMAIFKVEKAYTKEEILEFYVNSNLMGARKYGGAYGVEQASLIYFGKSAKDVNLSEAAILAGLFQLPNVYDPYINPERTKDRRATVLSLMERHGYITKEEREAANAIPIEDLIVEHEEVANDYQGFIDTVTVEVEKATGLNPYIVPMEIYTTMDKDKQLSINKIFNGETYKWENEVVNAGAAVVDVETGAIVAVGAGRNKTGAKTFNYATSIKRQIGSTAKPLFDYAPGIEYNNWSTYYPFIDEEHTYSNGVRVDNWDNKFNGFMTLREALVVSRNIPALKAFQQVSKSNIKTMAANLGLSPELEGGIIHEAHSLGGYNGESPLSVAAAYAAFSNGGYYTEPYSYTKVILRDTGEVIEHKPKKVRAMSEETAYMMFDMLVDTAKWGLSPYANVNGKRYGAKTGTTNFSQEAFKQYKLPSNAINDLWVAGMDPEYSISIWYGYDKIDRNYVTRFGSREHSKLFQAVAKTVFTGNKAIKKPNNVIEVTIEKETYPAMLASEFTPSNMKVTELFKKGTEPTDVSKRYSKLNNVTNLDAKEDGNAIILTWDPIKTPDAISLDYLQSHFNKVYKKESDQQKYLNERLNYNKNNIGEISYNIYQKLNDGTLSLIGNTKETSFKHQVNSPGNITYVVKTTYTIFKENASDGAEISINASNVETVIISELQGEKNVILNVGDTFIDDNPIKVLENLIPITENITITKTIHDQNNNVVLDIDTSSTGVYTITYNVKYKSHNQTHTRTITIQ